MRVREPMVASLALVLALATAVAPAAHACTCAAVAPNGAEEAGCCCAGPGVSCCGCCEGEDTGREADLGAGCPCTRESPQRADTPPVEMPAAGFAHDTPPRSAPPVARGRDVEAQAPARDPIPEVRLPLLI